MAKAVPVLPAKASSPDCEVLEKVTVRTYAIFKIHHNELEKTTNWANWSNLCISKGLFVFFFKFVVIML